MTYFIYRVTTYSNQGKNRKGRILQSVAERFANAVLDADALSALKVQLRRLVDVLNEKFAGSKLSVFCHQGQIAVGPEQKSFESNYVFMISFEPIKQHLAAFNIRDMVLQGAESCDDAKGVFEQIHAALFANN